MDRKLERARKIRAAMVRKGISCVEVGNTLGVSAQMVSMVIYGKATSARVVQALADAGVPANLLKEDAA